MSTILEQLEKEIANVSTAVEAANIGIVREIGDGVAKVEGLSDVQLNEMIEFPGGITGLALNLEEGEVGVVLLGDFKSLKEGDTTKELALKYKLHPQQINTWKREFIENSSKAFDSKAKTEEVDKEKSALYSKIGQLQVENDFLKKVLEK